jgi:hypothetical protein
MKTAILLAALAVTGEDLAWRVETPLMIVDMSKNPGTGRSGQINTIFYKPAGVLLTRGVATSTLHLSPNAAPETRWNGINRWDPPAAYSAAKTKRGFRVEREGPMPFAPNLYVKTTYEIFSDEPVIAVEESIEARADASLTLMRLCEWSFSPEAANPFTHIAWADAGGKVTVKKKEKTEDLPLDLRWMAFFNPEKRLGFAAIVERFEPGKFLWHPASRFAGDPHYFYRGTVLSPDQKPVTVPRGNLCRMRYTIFLFQPGPGEHALDPVIGRARP